jgi:hypothetical protein
MISSTNNTKPDASPPRTITASAVEIEANRLAADQMAKQVLEGLRNLAKQKASRRVPDQAA